MASRKSIAMILQSVPHEQKVTPMDTAVCDGIAKNTIRQMLRAGATSWPELPAIISPKRPSLSYARLCRQVEGVAAWLNRAGIGPGDRVAIVLPNGPEMAVAFLGVSATAVSAPLNPNYRSDDFDFYLADLNAKALIVQSGVDSEAIAAARSRGIPLIELSSLSGQEAGMFTLNGVALAACEGGKYAESEDVALVLHTSGTTSRPKRVPLTHANLCASAQNVAACLALSDRDRCLSVMPLFHIHGIVGSMLASLWAGGSIVCTPGFDATTFFKCMDEFQPTWYTAVPTIHQEILRCAPQTGEILAMRKLRFVRSSSSALPPRVMKELEAVFAAPVIEAYGMTEAAHQIASNPLPPRSRKAGSVGLATGSDIAIMGEQGELLPAGQAGEVVIRGGNVTHGYENNPTANALVFASGWCRTGDQGVLDDDGYLRLTGRLKEIINRGGEKIAPREIDEALLNHPDVQEAAAFAVPHATLGETIAAVVVPRIGKTLSESELREFALGSLPEFKVPTRIVIVKQIPKGPTGKLQRTALAGLLEQELTTRYEAPAEGMESLIATHFEQLLHAPRVGRHDNFFALGGDSILAMQVVARLINPLEIEIPLIVLFRYPTPSLLAIELTRLKDEQDIASLAAELKKLSPNDADQMLRKGSHE